jgi:N-acetylneuraminic acid mutarotase
MNPTFMKWELLPPLPDPEGFAGMFAGPSGDTLLVAGGANFPDTRPWDGGKKRWYDTIFLLRDAKDGWHIGGRLPRPAGYGVSINTGTSVLCAGGSNAERHLDSVFTLTMTERGIDTHWLPPLPCTCAHMSGALLNDHVYIAGRLEGPDATSAMKTFWTLNLQKPDLGWRVLPPCPGPARMLAASGVTDTEFCVFGGINLNVGANGKTARSYLKDAYAYRPEAGWRRLADLPSALAAGPSPAPRAPDGSLLLLTGDDGKSGHVAGPNHPGFRAEMFAYHPAQNFWSQPVPIPFGRVTLPSILWRGRWIFPSGEGRPPYRTPEGWELESSFPQ